MTDFYLAKSYLKSAEFAGRVSESDGKSTVESKVRTASMPKLWMLERDGILGNGFSQLRLSA